MEFNPNAESSSFEQIPDGVYVGRCVRLVELGQQSSEMYPEPKWKVQIWLTVPKAPPVMVNGEEKQPTIGNLYGITMSTSDKGTMKQYASALDPMKQGTNLGYFLDQPCQFTVKANQKGRATIDQIGPVVPGTEVPEVDIPLLHLKWAQPDPEVWKQLPEITKEIIKGADNYSGSLMEAMVNDTEVTI